MGHVSVPVVQAVEIVRESAQGRMDVASRKLDGANVTAKKGLVRILEHFAQKTDDDGDDQPAEVCFGSDHCVGCKQEMVDQEGCGREPVSEGLVYCEEKYGKCPF